MAGKRLSAAGIELSKVTRDAFISAKAKINPLLIKSGINAGWTSGGAGSFDPEHPYPGTLRTESGDIDIMIDPTELMAKFPADINNWNASRKTPDSPKVLANAMADPTKRAKLQLSASKAALAEFMSANGMPTDPGNLTVHYTSGGKSYSVDLIIRQRSAWPLHTHDFSLDPQMRGGDLWDALYPMLAKLASDKVIVNPKTGEEKGNLQFSPDQGIVDRETGKIIASGEEKDKIAKLLLHPSATAKDLSSLTGIKNILQNQPEKWNAVKGLFPSKEISEHVKFGSAQWMRALIEKL